MSLHRQLRAVAFQNFRDIDDFSTLDKAKEHITALDAPRQHSQLASELTSRDSILRIINEHWQRLSGGKNPIEWETGDWLHFMPGKPIFNHILSGPLFEVRDQKGNLVTSPNKQKRIAEKLASSEIARQPIDFQTLLSILKAHVTAN